MKSIIAWYATCPGLGAGIPSRLSMASSGAVGVVRDELGVFLFLQEWSPQYSPLMNWTQARAAWDSAPVSAARLCMVRPRMNAWAGHARWAKENCRFIAGAIGKEPIAER
jgi:hypothetical protein